MTRFLLPALLLLCCSSHGNAGPCALRTADGRLRSSGIVVACKHNVATALCTTHCFPGVKVGDHLLVEHRGRTYWGRVFLAAPRRFYDLMAVRFVTAGPVPFMPLAAHDYELPVGAKVYVTRSFTRAEWRNKPLTITSTDGSRNHFYGVSGSIRKGDSGGGMHDGRLCYGICYSSDWKSSGHFVSHRVIREMLGMNRREEK